MERVLEGREREGGNVWGALHVLFHLILTIILGIVGGGEEATCPKLSGESGMLMSWTTILLELAWEEAESRGIVISQATSDPLLLNPQAGPRVLPTLSLLGS